MALFDAAGYAIARPAVHPHVIERVSARLSRKTRRALDVGCGAGLSTRPLERLADVCIGIEPQEAMLAWASATAPGAHFLVGRAEALPIRERSIDVITAAGSFNYTDLDRALAEALRVLTSQGVLVIYDFSQGRTFRSSEALDQWFLEFVSRYPPPPHDAIEIDPRSLAARDSGFRVDGHEDFEIPLMLSPEFYLDYALTETNVTFAISQGEPQEEIRTWCRNSLGTVFQGQTKEVLFRGYIAYLYPAA